MLHTSGIIYTPKYLSDSLGFLKKKAKFIVMGGGGGGGGGLSGKA